MATEGKQLTVSITAGEDLTTHQYKAISVADGQRATTDLEATGILQNKPANGEEARVVVVGETKVYVGGAVTAGGRVGVTTGGLMIAVTSGTASGQSLQTVTGSGSFMRSIVNFGSVFDPA